MVEPVKICENMALFTVNYPQRLFIAFKMTSSCCFR